MPNSPILNKGDDLAAKFAKDLEKVMRGLEKSLVDVVNGAQTARNVFDSQVLLNSRPQMLQALREAGYYDLASQYVAEYPEMAREVSRSFTKAGLPKPEFPPVDKETFRQLAGADFEQFAFIGESAMDELRFGLHKQAVSSAPFSEMVDSVKKATVGTAKNGSPLANYAYTHANTSVLSFGGETIKKAGEAIGAEKWRVQGPLDDKTREECRDALSDPVRTEEEWISAGYFGGSPGGFNCRHVLWPVLEFD